MIAASISSIADRRGRQALREGEAGDQRAAEHGEHPEGRPRPLAAAQHAEDRGRERQQADEDDRMRRGDVLQRQRRQQRKADDDAERDDRPARRDRRVPAASPGTAAAGRAPARRRSRRARP